MIEAITSVAAGFVVLFALLAVLTGAAANWFGRMVSAFEGISLRRSE